MLSRDIRALEGLPLKLMIVALLVSMTFPFFLGCYNHYAEVLTCEGLESELEEIESAVYSTFIGGPGSVRTVEVTISLTAGQSSGKVEIGGSLGSHDARSLRYLAGELQGRRYLSDLPLEVSTESDRPLVIVPPGGMISLEYMAEESPWICVGLMI